MPLVNNFYDFSAGNSIKEIRKMETEMSKLLNISKSVVKEINKISNKKINLSLNTKGVEKGIKGVSDNINKISNKKINLNLNTKNIEKNIGNVSSRLKSLSTNVVHTMTKVNGSVSKLDNNMSSRGEVERDFSKLYDGIASYASQFSNALLPSGVSNIISGAANGLAAGMLTGNPYIAVASAIIGGGAELALSEVKKKKDRLNQRVSFGSSILKTYLPKIAMNSLNYASNIEQSRINYKNMLGEKDGDDFVNKLLRLSNKTLFDFSELDNFGKKLISSGFDSNESINVVRALGNASVAKGAGSNGVMQMIDALKNMKSTGKVSLDNLNAFDSIGIDAYGILADSIEIAGKKTRATKDELKELVSKGVIPADKAIKYLISGMEDRYAGMMIMEKQSFSGLISTIKDSANQIILGPLGEGFIKGIKPALKEFSEFFGLGTKGFKDLKEQIYSFGMEMGKFANDAIINLKNIFGQLFNDEEFKNADLPNKILMTLNEIVSTVDNWYKDEGKSLFDKTKEFFFGFIKTISEDSEFKNAIQDIWILLAPNSDTIGTIINQFYPKKTSPYKLFNDLYIEDKYSLNRSAIGLNRVPYDYYPALLHEGEAVLRRTEADNYRNGVGKGVIISKIADTIVVKDEADMYKIANILVSEIEKAGLVYGGAM